MVILSPRCTPLPVIDVRQGLTELCPDELPVPGGRAIVPRVNELLELPFARIDVTADWHPPDHCVKAGRRRSRLPGRDGPGRRGLARARALA